MSTHHAGFRGRARSTRHPASTLGQLTKDEFWSPQASKPMRSLRSIRPARAREGSVSTDRQRRHRTSVPLLPAGAPDRLWLGDWADAGIHLSRPKGLSGGKRRPVRKDQVRAACPAGKQRHRRKAPPQSDCRYSVLGLVGYEPKLVRQPTTPSCIESWLAYAVCESKGTAHLQNRCEQL